MLTHYHTLLRQDQYYRHEMMRFAERERLAQLATSTNRHFHRPLLAWAGRRLVRAGLALMSRGYGVNVETRAIPYRQTS